MARARGRPRSSRGSSPPLRHALNESPSNYTFRTHYVVLNMAVDHLLHSVKLLQENTLAKDKDKVC